ncbi:MAG: protein YgfX [Shewanella sp.]
MAERRHSFKVTASFDQRLSLVALMCVGASSLLLWPRTDLWFVAALQWGILVLLIAITIIWLWRLQQWQCAFVLNSKGEGQLASAEPFSVHRRTWVTPFVCLMYIQLEQQVRLIPLWADMFTDNDYRHLCRLLLQAKAAQVKAD